MFSEAKTTLTSLNKPISGKDALMLKFLKAKAIVALFGFHQ
jgi:hypothetical protein